eukprot:6285510-Ditylum_brightwellii.AAC.1
MADNGESTEIEDILVVDTGGGRNSTMAKRLWHVFERINHQQVIKGHGSIGKGKTCFIVNATTK